MNLQQCNNGHYFNKDKFPACPHCNVPSPNGEAGGSKQTVALGPLQAPDSPPMQITPPEPIPSISDAFTSDFQQNVQATGGDSPTVYVYESDFGSGKSPVVGWLVCIEGDHFGEDFRLKADRNFIGRSSAKNVNDIVIHKDNYVSREKHTVVTYVPTQHEFFVQPGESTRELTYLNGTVVLSPQTIKAYDVLTVGKTKLKFFPCCGKEFNWEMFKKNDEEKKR